MAEDAHQGAVDERFQQRGQWHLERTWWHIECVTQYCHHLACAHVHVLYTARL